MAHIRIDGVDYPIPEDLDLDEVRIVYEESGLNPEQLDELGEGFHPGVMKGMLIVAVMREKPELKRREVAEHVGKLKMSALAAVFVGDDDDADPPTEPLETQELPVSSGESGNAGSPDSPQEPVNPGSTGPPDSELSGSNRLISAS